MFAAVVPARAGTRPRAGLLRRMLLRLLGRVEQVNRPSPTWIARFVAWTLAHARLTTLALLASVIVAGVGATALRIEFSSRAFYAADADEQSTFAALQDAFGPDDGQLVVVVRRHDGDILDRGSLEAIAFVARHLAVIEGVAAVYDLSSFPAATKPGSDRTSVLAGHIEAQAKGTLDQWRQRLLTDRQLVPMLLAADTRSAAMLVELEHSSDTVEAIRPAVRTIEAFLAEHSRPDGMTYQIAGIPAVRSAFTDLVVLDQTRLGPLTLLIVGLGLVWRFRRGYAVTIPALTAAYPLVAIAGLMGATSIPVGLLSQTLFTLIPVLAVADTVHWIVRFHEQADAVKHEPWTPALRREVIVATATRIGHSCLLTSLTTALGFLSLLVTDIPLLRELGWLAALGIAVAYVGSLVLVPLMLDRIDDAPVRPRARHIRAKPRRDRLVAWLHRCADLATSRPRATALVATSLFFVAGFLAWRVPVDNRLLSLLDEDHAIHQASTHADTELGGVVALELLVRFPSASTTERRLAVLTSIEAAARTEPDVRAVLRPGAFGVDLADDPWAHDDGRLARVSVRMADGGGQRFEAASNRIAAHLTEAGLDERHGVDHEVATTTFARTGSSVLAYRGINQISEQLRHGFAIVLAVVTVLIAVLFRSIAVALLAFLPNVLPLLIGLATLDGLGFTVDPVAAVILTLAVGIAVDDTIHLLARVREELADGQPLPLALRRALVHCGPALVVTSLVLSAGLAVNLLSSFPPLTQLGMLGAIVMMAALVLDLVVLPALLCCWPTALVRTTAVDQAQTATPSAAHLPTHLEVEPASE